MQISLWVDALKIMGSSHTKKELRQLLKTTCQSTTKLPWDQCIIDGEKVWDNIVMTDPVCKNYAREHGFTDHCSIEAMMYYNKECIGYKTGKSTYSRFHSKR